MKKKEEIIEGLNEQQKNAVINYNGPTLIVAGAGSGKTRTITQRIAYMLNEGVRPEHILALTFTKKAAGEMRTRITEAVGRECMPWKIVMGTFHSVFIKFLTEFADKIGFPQKFTIYDENDSETLIKQIINSLEITDKQYKVNIIRNRISVAKNNLLTPAQYENVKELTEEDKSLHIPRFKDIFREYVKATKRNGAMDFDDILLYTHTLLRDNVSVRVILGERFKYILVDEYQDTNMVQYRILKYLTSVHHNICVVGDDSQSIYSFRGAKIENILRFKKDYPEAQTFLLERNYRSTSTIVNAANSVIKNNSRKLDKNLFSEVEGGEKIQVFSCESDRNEAGTVARDIKNRLLLEDNCTESDFAILYRNNFLSRLIEEELRIRSISYQIYGGFSFYKRKEILDVVSYMKFCLNQQDDVSFLRIINLPPRGIGETSLAKIKAKASEKGMHLWEVITTTSPEDLNIKGAALKGIKKFKNIIEGIISDENIQGASQYVNAIIDRSEIIQALQDTNTTENRERIENIQSLQAAVLEWESAITDNPEYEEILSLPADLQLQEWLASIALLSDSDTEDIDKPHVTLMTVHASKGLEFKYVYIIGAEEDLFPSERSKNEIDALEEERRIFYVALTRAKKFVGISWSSQRFRYGEYKDSRISRFVTEIDSQFVTGLAKRARRPWDIDDYPTPKSEVKTPWQINAPKPIVEEKMPWEMPSKKQSSNTTSAVTNTPPKITRKDNIIEIEESDKGLKKGDIVKHHVYGRGVIEKLEKKESDVRITIKFDVVGKKIILERFCNLKKL